MAQFFDNVITWFNSLGDIFDVIITILYAPFDLLRLLFKWFFSLFDFLDLFTDAFNWASGTLPGPLYDIGQFLVAFLLVSIVLGVIKIVVR